MTYVIQGGWAAAEGALLSQMYQERKRVFIDLLRWDLPVLDGRYEIDQFDTPSTIYLIIAGTDGAHLGSLRLLPTTQPHVLGSVFPTLCEDGTPQAPDVWEISRLCLSRGIRAVERRQVGDRLATALTLFALDNGIRATAAWPTCPGTVRFSRLDGAAGLWACRSNCPAGCSRH